MRLDQALTDRGLAPSRTKAAALVRSGHVTVNGEPATKPSRPIRADDRLRVDTPDHYVSRSAHKLLGALHAFDLTPSGRALDAGASTGGFTQVLLEYGVDCVYAVDVGHDQLHPMLRADRRVRVREGLNLRELTLDHLDGGPVDWLVVDVSFISLRLLLKPLREVIRADGHAVLMVKPQFEVGRKQLGAGGVVRDATLRERAITTVVTEAGELGWRCAGRSPSVLAGEYGNREEFLHLHPLS